MKRILILTLAALFVFNGCGNNGEATQETTKTVAEEKTEYFDFTVTEFVDTLADEYFTHLTFIATVPTDDGKKINTYTNGSPSSTTAPMVHYSITYDEKTEKVENVSFFLDKNFETDIPDLVLTYYFIHVGVVSSVIEPDIDTQVLFDEINKGFNDKELNLNAALCDRNKFQLYASNGGSYVDAMFTPKTF